MTDLKELIEAGKRGEELAWKLLYQRYSARMRALCYRYLGDVADTQDVVSESFMKVFTKMSQFKGKGSFEGWMKRIFINSCLTFLKEKQTSILFHGDDKLEQWDNQNIESPIAMMGTEKQQDLIRRMNFSKEELMEIMQTLPEGYRLVFNLYVFEKMKHKDIATVLNVSENTSKSQLTRARRVLQQKLYEVSLERTKELEDEQYNSLLRVVI